MKIRNVIQFLGFRGKSKHYTYEIHDIDLGDNIVHFACWSHPHRGEAIKTVTSQMIDAYREILNEGDFCIDIGAQTGDTTVPMAVAAGVNGCTLALEPNPYVYHVLEKNARANSHVANIKTMMAAAGTYEGFMKFEYSDAGFCNGGLHKNIPAIKHGHPFMLEVFCINLEKELREDYPELLSRLKFIKVDAEGYDLYILRSIRDIIKVYRPIIKAEVFKRTDTKYCAELLSFFSELGYLVYKIIDEPIGAGPVLTENNLNEWQHYDILCEPEDSITPGVGPSN